MNPKYSIDEILSAVDSINKNKITKKKNLKKEDIYKNDYSSVPKHTLRLIEEAEKKWSPQ